ncbi:MAG TPA: alpha/beta fold hydrolase [Dehalococcoidia bacterium]|nr:alpha/beta fold hydrolase [Dehalococcoidia bacterium]
MTTAKINDIEMYYEVHGPTVLPEDQADSLLLIMGLGANTTSWEMQIPAFSREYRTVAFDNRGSGRSDKPQSPYTIPQMADDAAALLDHLGISSAHVFGMSMGGMVAQEMALRHPQRVRTLVLGGTMAGGPNAVMAGPQLIQQWASTALLPLEQAIENGLRFLYSEEFIARNHERLVRRALDLAYLQPPLDALQRQVMAVLQFNTFQRLADVTAPTLVISGTADQIVPPENSRILAERIPGAQLIELEGAGHGFLAEKAEETNSTVLAFLRRQGGGSPK